MANRSKDSYREEVHELKKRVRELEKALDYSKLETSARDLMIDKAEEYFEIPIRKKIRGQAALEPVNGREQKISVVCRLFGHCRQAFYQLQTDIIQKAEHERRVIESVREIRAEDAGIGGYKLWLMLTAMYGRDYVSGRDSFFALLRRKGLMLPKPNPRHTTNSNHRYHKWKNLIKGFVPTAANRLWVADITYIPIATGDVCYLHLITDAYSHKVVGWALADTFRAAITIAVRQKRNGCLQSVCL